VAEALCYGTTRQTTEALRQLEGDPVPFVRQAAAKSIREARKITTKVYEKRDPTAERLFSLIRKINPRNIRESYAAALQVGQIYYRELAGITTHELKTSLFYLSGVVDELLKTSEGNNSTMEEHRHRIHKAMKDVLRMVSGLTDLTSKPQKDVVFKVVPVIQKVIEEARTSTSQTGEDAIMIIPLGLWGNSKVKGDPALLKVAFRNLLINAIEASPVGKKVLLTLDTEENSLVVSIQDEGTGMTDQQIEDAFKPFSSSKKDKGGMGLGIPIAQKIIHFDFGGEVRYESEVGKGTRVYVELPLHKGSSS